jgi:NAD(P)H-dependent flavin oxidoreductase YrpB (nitropropane dioxygenase family)
MLGADVTPPEGLTAMIRATRALTRRPFGIDLLGPFITDGHIDAVVDARVALVVSFWGAPTPAQIERLRTAGIAFWMQIGSVEEALAARHLGAETLVVQGSEGGGHNRAVASTMNLLPAVREAVAPIPVVAAGGIVDGRSLAAALALGADAVWCGTRFLASAEADAHPGYQARVLAAGVADTCSTTLFGPEWPDQPMRVIRNGATQRWEGREAEAHRACAGTVAGTLETPEGPLPLPAFSIQLPTRAVTGDLDQLCLTAGESAGRIGKVEAAGTIVRRMTEEAEATLRALAERLPGRTEPSAEPVRAASGTGA